MDAFVTFHPLIVDNAVADYEKSAKALECSMSEFYYGTAARRVSPAD